MAGKCDICGKGSLSGNRVSHSKRHTRRRWQPNLHSAVVPISGRPQRATVCTRCLRTLRRSAA